MEMYNEVIMIKKLETNSKLGPFLCFWDKNREIANKFIVKTFFLDITERLRRKLIFVDRSGLLSYLGLKSGPRYAKG